METADDDIFEAVGLDPRPVLDLVGRDVLGIDRHVVARVGIGARSADGRHQLVVFIGDEQLGGLIGDTVYLMVDSLAFGLIGLGAIYLKKGLDLVEHGFFLFIVHRAKLLGAFKHEVL